MPRTFELHTHLGPVVAGAVTDLPTASLTVRLAGHTFYVAVGGRWEHYADPAPEYRTLIDKEPNGVYLWYDESSYDWSIADPTGGDVSVVATQSGDDVSVAVSVGSHTQEYTLTGATLGPEPPGVTLHCGTWQSQSSCSSTVGPLTITHSGITRHYDWNGDYDWPLQRDFLLWWCSDPEIGHHYNNYLDVPPHTTFSNGTMTKVGEGIVYSGGWIYGLNEWDFMWAPLDGPTVITMNAGTPRYRYVQDRAWCMTGGYDSGLPHGPSYAYRVTTEVDDLDGKGFVPGDDSFGQFGWAESNYGPTGFEAFVDPTGKRWFVLSKSGGAAYLSQENTWQQQISTGVFKPITMISEYGMLIRNDRYQPRVLLLAPSADVLVAGLDANNEIHITRLVAVVSGTAVGYSVGDDHVVVDVRALSLGGMWQTEDGTIGLSYTDTDGVAQCILSDASLMSWSDGAV